MTSISFIDEKFVGRISQRVKGVLVLFVFVIVYASFSALPYDTIGKIEQETTFFSIRHPNRLLSLEERFEFEESIVTKKVLTQDEVKSIDDTTMIVVLSLGEQAAQSPLIERCIRSVRGRGNFKGYFAVLTDAPVERYAEIMAADDKFVTLQIKDEDKRKDISPVAAMKFFKTLLLQYIQSDSKLARLDFITYMDFDIVVGADLHPFLNMMINEKMQEEAEDISTISFFEELNSDQKRLPFHSGVFFFNKMSSRCLELWGKEIVTNAKSGLSRDGFMDQSALAKLNRRIRNGNVTDCKLVGYERGDHILFPSVKNMEQRQMAPFIHVTNNFRANWIPGKLQDEFFADVLELSDDERTAGLSFTAKKVSVGVGDMKL